MRTTAASVSRSADKVTQTCLAPDIRAALAEKARPIMDREIKLCPIPESARKARGFVREHLTELGYPTLIDDGTLIVSELVTNSLAAAPSTPLWVDIRRAGQHVMLEVWDCSPKPLALKSPDAMAEDGRGLRIVSELSEMRFGCDTFPWGKVVWVTLA